VLTRLKVSGFKNLLDAEIRFGPFTCIAGPNAVGKSNLFDAIRFLSFLANDTLLNAALSIRSEGGHSGDIRSLFHRAGDRHDEKMAFEAEMIVPSEGLDDLGQRAEAAITFLRYTLEIKYKTDFTLPSLGSLQLLREELEHINLGDAHRLISFPHNVKAWRQSVLHGRRTSPFISTIKKNGDGSEIKLHQDGTKGRPKSFLAANLPRTVLSTVNATESPTALLARREMQSWRLLQLEPNALREPDKFTTPPGLGADGSHLAATLFYLARSEADLENRDQDVHTRVYDRVSARLSELIDDVYEVGIDKDQQRELLTLQVTERDGTVYPARSLSDGTLRFLALTVIDMDPAASGVICLEEPENGLHPDRIPAMLRLLQDIACDPESPVGPDNTLRQVIVNTHSPAVVSQVLDDSLLSAELKEVIKEGTRCKTAHFGWLADTWRSRAEPDKPTIARGRLLPYLNPISASDSLYGYPEATGSRKRPRRVADRLDMQGILPFVRDEG
jgi:predicted ATPase